MTTDQLHILLVEDQAILALDLKAKLQHEGYRVVGTAATGQRALELFARERVDLNRDTILRIENQVFVKSNQQFVRINLTEVLYLEAEDIYTTLVTPQKKYVLRLSLTQVLDRISYVWFVRVHRSYAVNIEQVEAFSEQEITIGPKLLPLGRSYRETFIDRFTFR